MPKEHTSSRLGWVKEAIQAFNAHDLDGWMRFYALDATHTQPNCAEPLCGQAEIRSDFQVSTWIPFSDFHIELERALGEDYRESFSTSLWRCSMSEQYKRMIRRNFEEIWNQGNYATVDELIASDYVGHSPPDDIHAPEGVKQFVGTMRRAFPDLQFTVEDQIAEGDKVVTRWAASGTHQGEFQGIPPTGMQATVPGITVDRIANGKVVEGWTNWDALGLLQKLGAVPAPEQAG